MTIAIDLCDRFLEIMEGLEKAGMAHTDISPGNIMVGFDPIEVQLLDLEDMYMPGVDAPLQPHSGSNGYSHRSGETTWKPEGDRYAAAVLAAEMLVLANPELARKATDEGYFTDHCQTPEGMARFREARLWLEEVATEFAEVFERSWYADSLEGCPSISELREPIQELATRPLAPESPKRVERPISRQPSPGPKAGVETPLTHMNQRQDWWKRKDVLGAVATVFAGLDLVVFGILGITASVNLVPTVYIAVLIGTLGGLVGLHTWQASSYGKLGMAGFLLAFVGTTLSLVAVVIVFLLGDGRDLDPSEALGLLSALTGLVLSYVGFVLLGVATLRVRVLPRWCGVALIIAAHVSVLLPLSGILSDTLFLGFEIVFGLVWLALGYALWSRRNITPDSQLQPEQVEPSRRWVMAAAIAFLVVVILVAGIALLSSSGPTAEEVKQQKVQGAKAKEKMEAKNKEAEKVEALKKEAKAKSEQTPP